MNQDSWDFFYILENKTPVPCPDIHAFATFFKNHKEERLVALTQIGDYRVSTVFLGIDHNFSDEGDPLVFETMIFGGNFDGEDEYQTRCSTWEQAEAQHREAINYLGILLHTM
jgi:hypothetical protein